MPALDITKQERTLLHIIFLFLLQLWKGKNSESTSWGRSWNTECKMKAESVYSRSMPGMGVSILNQVLNFESCIWLGFVVTKLIFQCLRVTRNTLEIAKFSLPRQANPLSSFKGRMVYWVGSSTEIRARKSFLVKNSSYTSCMTLGR